MEGFLNVIEGSTVAQALRFSRWGYASVNGVHVFGIALLVGASVPMALRLLGAFRFVDAADLIRVLRPVAAVGFSVAVVSGGLLFGVRAGEYAPLGIFQVKMVLVLCGAVSALIATRKTPPSHLKIHAIISLICWPAALACGRSIGFVM